eukprot:SAG31_NODE_39937_length_284_cov_0.945946_2_plen_21_part_01
MVAEARKLCCKTGAGTGPHTY